MAEYTIIYTFKHRILKALSNKEFLREKKSEVEICVFASNFNRPGQNLWRFFLLISVINLGFKIAGGYV